MKSILIRDLSEDVVDRLKSRAERHHRSVQGEIRAIIENATREIVLQDPGKLDIHTVSVGGDHTWSRDEIYED